MYGEKDWIGRNGWSKIGSAETTNKKKKKKKKKPPPTRWRGARKNAISLGERNRLKYVEGKRKSGLQTLTVIAVTKQHGEER